MRGWRFRNHDATLITLSKATALTFFPFHFADDPEIARPVIAQEWGLRDSLRCFPLFEASDESRNPRVQLGWQPESSTIGHEIIYLAKFLREKGSQLSSKIIRYDFEIVSAEGALIEGFCGQETEDDNIGRPFIIEFEEREPDIYCHTCAFCNRYSIGEECPVGKQVTLSLTGIPEFSTSALLLVLAGFTGTIVSLTRGGFVP